MDDEPEKPIPPRRGWRRFVQFRMGTILILMLVIAFSTGWIDWKRRHYQGQRDAIREIEKLDGSITMEPLGPAWWHAVLGDDHVKVTHVSLEGEEVTDGDLRLLACLTDLRGLNLDCCRVRGRGLKYLACQNSLEVLTLLGAEIVDDDLTHLSGFTRLKLLTLHGTQVRGEGLKHIATAPLESLSLHGNDVDQLNLKDFRATLSSLDLGRCVGSSVEIGDLPKLANLELWGAWFHELYLHDLPNWNQASLAVNATSVRLENLPNLTEFEGEDLASIHFESMPALRTFRTKGTKCYLTNLRGAPRLTTVQLVDYPMPSLMSDLSQLPELKTLAWDYQAIWSQRSLRLPIKCWPDLESLALYGPWVDDEALVEIVAAKKLNSVALSHTAIENPTLARLTALHHLEALGLDHVKAVDDAALARLAVHQHLKVLTLRGTSITDEGLRHLADLPALENLDLSNTLITDAGLFHLKGLPLKHLRLNETGICGEGLEQLAGIHSLQSLDLNRTLLTDAGMKVLGQMNSLEILQLAETPISIEGLEHLHGMPNLRCLNLAETNLTEAALEAFAQSIPQGIDITHRNRAVDYGRPYNWP